MNYIKCQCGYSRLGGQGMDAGWQSIKLSGIIDPELERDYSTLMGQNVTNQALLDKDGNPINTLEIIGRKDKVFMSRIQYGLSDDVGRKNNFFAHTVVFDGSKDSIFRDPNVFLTVEDCNFITSYDERKNVSDDLRRCGSFTKKSALEMCGISYDKYKQLIFAIYGAMAQKRPLYIKLEDYAVQIRPCLYLIYIGLPLALRRTLTASTKIANPGNDRTIVFSDEYNNSNYWLDLKSGENNILTPKMIKRFERYGYPGICIDKSDSDSNQFFQMLEEIANKIGDASASQTSSLIIAYKIMTTPDVRSISEDERLDRLYYALTSGYDSALMDHYIDSLVAIANDGGEALPDEVLDLLSKYIVNCPTPKTVSNGRTAIRNGLLAMETAPAVDKLREMGKDAIHVYAPLLEASEHGVEIVNKYIKDMIDNAMNYSDLSELFKEYQTLFGQKERSLAIFEKAYKMYDHAIETHNPVIDEYNKCAAFLEVLKEAHVLAGYDQILRKCYWDHFDYNNFTFEDEETYKFMRGSDYEKSNVLDLLFEIKDAFIKDDSDAFISATDRFTDRAGGQFNYELRKKIWDLLIVEAKRAGAKIDDADICELIFTVGDMNAQRHILSIFIPFRDKDFEGFEHAYTNYATTIYDAAKSVRVLDLLDGCLLAIDDKVTNRFINSLDFWLISSERRYDNPFMFLDKNKEVAKLYDDKDEEYLIADSRLMFRDDIIGKAEEYVDSGRNANTHMVKKWLARVRKVKKKEGKNGKKLFFGRK